MRPLRMEDGPAAGERAGIAHHIRDLWREAPTWRLLAASTVALALVAATMPVVMARHDDTPAQVAVASTPQGTLAQTAAPVAVATPAVRGASQDATPSCTIAAFAGASGEGVVLGFLSPDAAALLLSRTEAHLGGKINPAFLDNPRAVVGVGTPTRRVVALVPRGMMVKRGDHVVFSSGHRDTTMPCGYVPNLIETQAPSAK